MLCKIVCVALCARARVCILEGDFQKAFTSPPSNNTSFSPRKSLSERHSSVVFVPDWPSSDDFGLLFPTQKRPNVSGTQARERKQHAREHTHTHAHLYTHSTFSVLNDDGVWIKVTYFDP